MSERINNTMAKKTVRVDVPDNVDGLMTLIERILQKNDGGVQDPPASWLPWAIAEQLGAPLTQARPSQTLNPIAPTAVGTKSISEEIMLPLRTMFPAMKRRHLDLLALRALAQTTAEALSHQLGIAPGQSATDKTKARGLVGIVRDALLVVHADNEQALEGYGFTVVIGTAAVGRRKAPPTP